MDLSRWRRIPCFPFIFHSKEESPVSHSSFTVKKNPLFLRDLSLWRGIPCFSVIYHSEEEYPVSHGSFTLKKSPLFLIHLSPLRRIPCFPFIFHSEEEFPVFSFPFLLLSSSGAKRSFWLAIKSLMYFPNFAKVVKMRLKGAQYLNIKMFNNIMINILNRQ